MTLKNCFNSERLYLCANMFCLHCLLHFGISRTTEFSVVIQWFPAHNPGFKSESSEVRNKYKKKNKLKLLEKFLIKWQILKLYMKYQSVFILRSLQGNYSQLYTTDKKNISCFMSLQKITSL